MLVTSTVIWQLAIPLLRLAPVTVMTAVLAGALMAPVPEGQDVVTFGVPAIVMFAGNVSAKLMPDCAGLPVPLVIVNVSVLMPP